MNDFFSSDLISRIEADYQAASGRLSPFKKKISGTLTGLTEEEALCLKFCLTNMPIQDLLSVPLPLVLETVRHTLTLLERDPVIRTIPADIFLSYLLFYRVNNENIEFNRAFFYNALQSRIAGKTKREAILEVNYWCGENVTYQSTDERTAAPLTTFKRGFGRCGEESTFLVSALRSVGIPARQIYTPRWAHCDDNHAWVEAFAEGEWYYLGACEPEPRLDKGWFTASASKAILIQAKSFGTRFESERVSSATDISALINRTAKYGRTRRATVRVLADGEPLAGVDVRFEIVNYAELFPVLTVRTDENGVAAADFGAGTVHLSAVLSNRDGSPRRAGFAALDLTEDREIELELIPPDRLRPYEFLQRPPIESRDFLRVSAALIPDHAERMNRAASSLAARETAITSSPRRTAFRSGADYQERFEPFLAGARGNSDEIVDFLENREFSAEEKFELLSTLRDKDLVDIRAETLVDALRTAKPYRPMYDDAVYLRAVLAPRVANEMLTTQRQRIAAFYRSQGISFDSVRALYEDWTDRIRIDSRGDYGDLTANAIDVLTMRIADRRSADIAFVSVARALGFAADLDPVAAVPRGFYDGAFRPLRPVARDEGNDPEREIRIETDSDRGLRYWDTLTIQRFEKGNFRTADYSSDLTDSRAAKIRIPRGVYRIVAATRQIDGSVKASVSFLSVTQDSANRVSVAVPAADDMTTLFRYAPLPSASLQGSDGAALTVPAHEPGGEVLAFIEIGAEPTEHFFNELIEAAEEIRALNLPIRLICGPDQDLTQRTFRRVLAALPSAARFTGADETFEPELHRLMNAGDERRPFILAVNSEGAGLYAFSNYNVGTVKLVLEILKAEREKFRGTERKTI